MPYWIGTDEAGYGPNLGPLVITATVWRVSHASKGLELYELLRNYVCRTPENERDERLAIADSKQLYQSGSGLAALERGTASAFRVCGQTIDAWQQVWSAIAGLSNTHVDAIPWHEGYDEELPVACDRQQLDRSAQRFAEGLAASGIELRAIRSAVVFPDEFNDQLEQFGNKSSLLSERTLGLVRDILRESSDEPVLVHCDKHGGRNHYSPVLQTMMTDSLVEIVSEGRGCSVYRWGPPERRTEFRFVAKGEKFLPTALASMVSKYLRELAMRPFNAFWARHIPGLKPTAGYSTDSRRFKTQIADKQRELGIPDRLLWRCR